MAVSAINPLSAMSALQTSPAAGISANEGSGFGQVLGQMLAGNQQANAAADQAINELVTGQAQDLHTVSMAVAQADLSFRMILEMRNRLADAFQEVTRMQV